MHAGESSLRLSIGGLRCDLRLVGFRGPLPARLRRRYAPFLRSPAASDVGLRLAPMPDRPGRPSPAEVRREGATTRLLRSDFDVALQDRSGEGRVAPDLYAFDSFLRVLWTLLLSNAEGGLFHAAGVQAGGLALLFPGRSGAGKSTLARKVKPPARVLSDELVPVRRGPRGWEAYGAPFWGEFRAGKATAADRPLARIAFLRQGPTLGVRRLSTAETARRLLETYLCFDDDAAAHLAFVSRLAGDVPAVELTSPLRSTFARIRAVLSQ